MVQRFVPGLLGLVLSAAVANAQAALTVPTNIGAGDDITIDYSDPSRAGQSIVVVVDSYDPSHHRIELVIYLDQRGVGNTTWTVPDAWSIEFNAPGTRQVTRVL